MKARALKTFAGRYGMIRTGNIFECEPGYFQALKRNGMVEEVKDRVIEAGGEPGPANPPNTPGPSDDRDLKRAPGRAGKETPGDQRNPPGDTERRTAGGAAMTSRSLRADLHSRRKTPNKSGAGDSQKPSTPAPTPAADT